MGEWEWVHAVIGGLATLIFLIQTFGVIHGADFDSSADGYDGGDTVSPNFGGSLADYLSIRNFVAFFIGYGWMTMTALLSGMSRIMASALGVCAGIVLVVISLYLIKAFLKFQENGTLDLNNLTGKRASVYITVGGSASGTGKVMVDTSAGRVELPARTNDPDAIPPGRMATILRTDGGVLLITAKDE
jgi:hypothetical protein